MEDNDLMKEVYFHEWCAKCAFKEMKESEEPCYSCLQEPARHNSHKPEKFMEKSSTSRK